MNQMPNGFHTHNYNGITLISNLHDHGYSGRTSSDPDKMGHTHIMEGTTTNSEGHTHLYRMQTRPAVYRNDSHYHCYQGDTDMTNMHTHGMDGCVSIE